MAGDPDLDVLFTTPPDRFVGVRNELARQAKDSGRVDLAIRLKALRKPNVATWLVNSLARRHRDVVELVLREGKALRDAYSLGDRDAIREATRRRHRALGDAIRVARETLRQSGGRNVDERRLAATLLGASLDENAGKRLLRGELDREIEPPAFEAMMDAAATPSKRVRPASTVTAKQAAEARRASDEAARQSKLRKSKFQAVRRKMESAERAAAREEAAARKLDENATRARARAESAQASAAKSRKVADQLRAELAGLTERTR